MIKNLFYGKTSSYMCAKVVWSICCKACAKDDLDLIDLKDATKILFIK